MAIVQEIPTSCFLEAKVFGNLGSNGLVLHRYAMAGSLKLEVLCVPIGALSGESLEEFVLSGEELVYLISKRSVSLVQYLHISPVPVQGDLRLFREPLYPSLKDILSEYAPRGHRLSSGSIERICCGILDAVAALHHQSPPMLHGSICADQIYVQIDRDSGEIGSVKLNCPSSSNRWIRPEKRELFGTSPEMLAPSRSGEQNAATLMSDIFSFGLVLFWLIALERPYKAMDEPAVLKAICQGRRPSFPAAIDFSEYFGLVSVFTDCTEMDPWYRPSASSLLRDPRLTASTAGRSHKRASEN